LAGSAYEFSCGRLNIYQTLLAKPERGKAIFRSRESIGIEARKAQKTTIPLQNSPLETIIKKINQRHFDKFRFFA